MTRIENITNIIEYYDAEVALCICKHNGYYYLSCLQKNSKEIKLYSCSSLINLKDYVERYGRSNMTTLYKKGSELADWNIEFRISRMWTAILSEILLLKESKDFEEVMNNVEQVKDIPDDPCAGPVYFGIE